MQAARYCCWSNSYPTSPRTLPRGRAWPLRSHTRHANPNSLPLPTRPVFELSARRLSTGNHCATARRCRLQIAVRYAHSAIWNEIPVVAPPYNAHVTVLCERRASRGLRVGTVDKFQGQEPRCYLLDGHVYPGRRATWDGVPLQPYPAQRGDVLSSMCVHPGC